MVCALCVVCLLVEFHFSLHFAAAFANCSHWIFFLHFLYLRCLIFIWGFFDVRDIFSRYLWLSVTFLGFFFLDVCEFRSIFVLFTSLTPHIIYALNFEWNQEIFLHLFFCAFYARTSPENGGKCRKQRERNWRKKNYCQIYRFDDCVAYFICISGFWSAYMYL